MECQMIRNYNVMSPKVVLAMPSHVIFLGKKELQVEEVCMPPPHNKKNWCRLVHLDRRCGQRYGHLLSPVGPVAAGDVGNAPTSPF